MGISKGVMVCFERVPVASSGNQILYVVATPGHIALRNLSSVGIDHLGVTCNGVMW